MFIREGSNSPSPRGPARRRSGLAPALTLLFSGLAGPGCAHYKPTETGFLADYSGLRKDPFHVSYAIGIQRARTQHAQPEAAGQVDSYYIEPVRWLVDPATRAGGEEGLCERLSLDLDTALREQLGGLKPIVDAPGPRTARIRSAVTAARLSRPITNVALTATLILPYSTGPLFFGGGSVEAEAIGPDGRRLAAVTASSSGGYFDILGFYTRSGHARKAMRRCAKELKEALDHQ